MKSGADNLPDDPVLLKQMLLLAQGKVAQLQEQVALLRHKLFSPKSERSPEDADSPQLAMFNEAEELIEAPAAAPGDVEEVVAPLKRRGKRKPLPVNLPRVEVVYELPEHELTCACGCRKQAIGEETSEQLEIIPMQVRVIRHIRKTYTYKACEAAPVTADKPAQVIEKSLASPSVLAMLLATKYADRIPLYRFEKMLSRHGIDIPRQPLARWVIQSGEQPSASRTQSRSNALSGLLAVRQAARRDRRVKFTSLLHHVTVELLHESFYNLKRDAASGVDGLSWREYAQGLHTRLTVLHDKVHSGRYRAQPVRRVFIPKADGSDRPLGVTALEDKIVQTAVAQVLNAIYEQNFLGFSYGFRPGRGQHDALDALSVGIQNARVRWILDVDIQAFFDTIDHDWMMCFLQHRIADRRILALIARWLRTGVLENGKRIPAKQGTPQGAPISPLLANIYLHYVMDLWVRQWRGRSARGQMITVRYADDSVLGFERQEDAWRFRHALRARLAQFNLVLHPEKTRLLRFGWFAVEDRRKRGKGKPETFDFLGFTHACDQTRSGMFVVRRVTIAKRMRAAISEIRAQLHRRRHEPVPVIGQWLNRMFRGYCNYYHVPGNTRRLDAFRREVIGAWRHALKRRSQRHRLNWKRMTALAKLFLPYPRELPMHPHPIARFGVKTQGRSRMR